MYTITHLSSMSRKMSFMNDWKTDGLLARPKGITKLLVVPTSGREGRFPFISLSNANQVVGIAEI